VKLLSDYLNVYDHNPPKLQTDGPTDDFPRQYHTLCSIAR